MSGYFPKKAVLVNNSFSLKMKNLDACWWIFIAQRCAV